MKNKLSQAERTRVIIDLSSSQYQHLYNIMCSQEQIIDTLNESEDFDPQTFDNLFDAICNAKETYLTWTNLELNAQRLITSQF